MTETTKTESASSDSTSSTSTTSTSTAPSTSTSTSSSTSTSTSTSSTSTSLSSPSPSLSSPSSTSTSTSTSIAASSSPHPHVLSSTSASFVPALSPASSSSTTSIPKNIPPGEHALETPWTFYFDKKLITPAPGAGPTHVEYKNYEQNLQKLGTVHTVEQFWKHFSHMTSPDELPKDHNVYFFRNQAIPAWETFPNGGCWILKVRKRNGVINRLWEELCFAMIGEWFGEPGIAGIGLSSRARDDNISVWNVDNHIPEVRFNIGEKLKEILNLDESTQIEYKFFRSAIAEGSTFRNAKAYVYAAQAAYLPVTHA